MSTIEKALAKRGNKNNKPSVDKETTENQTTIEQHAAAIEQETAATEQSTVESTAASPSTDAASPSTEAVTPSTEAVMPSDEQSDMYLNIDIAAMNEKGLIPLSDERSRKTDEYRAIKRKILSTSFGPLSKTLTNSNIIMVSSARPNEGKTFTAINLALSIALEKDKTVLLVDADVLRPSVSKELGVKTGNGLMEYLLGDCESLSEVIYKTNIDKLRIIPAGKTHHLSTELLSSEKMLSTVNEFSSRYSDRVVIFDTPPLLGINETTVLANLAGQAVIVVEENHSKLRLVKEAVDLLSPDMAKGFVINKSIRSSGVNSNYYYGYYYGSDSES